MEMDVERRAGPFILSCAAREAVEAAIAVPMNC